MPQFAGTALGEPTMQLEIPARQWRDQTESLIDWRAYCRFNDNPNTRAGDGVYAPSAKRLSNGKIPVRRKRK
ncbi:hypothetical protein [Pseudomonas citronellolis]|uniref:hypothetical protein n=1 Tax=Pseudomonas citronellolis TaxID=53408 RepID=UPI00248F29AB|nr:hypothetical protein [Pseudomonas citronellolis]